MSGTEKIKGIYPALVTPYDASGEVDLKMVQKLTAHLTKCGADGFFVGGSSGESYLLTPAERKKILEAVIEAAAPGQKIMAHVGMLSTQETIALAKHAQDAGADAVSAVPPFYFRFTINELAAYYADLSAAVDIPVLVYNIPTLSGITFTYDEMDRLLQIPGVEGMKYTSYDLFSLQRLIRKYPEKSLFLGYDELLLSALSFGADAAIGSTYNIMLPQYISIVKEFAAGNLKAAQDMQACVNEVMAALCEVGIFKGIKAVLAAQGFDCGDCRRPFLPLTAEEKAKALTAAEKAGII